MNASVSISVGTRRTLGLYIAAAAVVILVGCGRGDSSRVPVHPVLGAIQFRGQPIVGAFVALHPNNGVTGVPSPRATVGPDGSFALSTYDGNDGAPEGEYILTAQWYKPVKQGNEVVGGPNVLPRRYSSPHTSDVKVLVVAGQNRLKPIQLR
jgi:hypothetical protein